MSTPSVTKHFAKRKHSHTHGKHSSAGAAKRHASSHGPSLSSHVGTKRRSHKFKGGLHRKRGKRRGQRGTSRKSLLKTLTVPNYFDKFDANICSGINSSGSTTRVPCAWLYPSGSTSRNPAQSAANSTWLGDYAHIMSIANQIGIQIANPTTGSLAPSNPCPNNTPYKFFLQRAVAKYEIHNQNNSNMWVRAYKICPRKDIPLTLGSALTSTYGIGLANSGADPGNSSNSNNYIGDFNCTLFQSPFFCEWFKIQKVKKFQLIAGARKTFRAKLKSQLVHPDHLGQLTSNTNYTNLAQLVAIPKASTLWMFQYMSTVGMTSFTQGTNQPYLNSNMSLELTTAYNYEYKYMQDNAPSRFSSVFGFFTGTTATSYSDVMSNVPYYLSGGTTAASSTVSIQTNDIQLY